MTSISASAAMLLSGLARTSRPSGGRQADLGKSESTAAGGASALFSPTALGLRAAKLNELADDALAAQKTNKATQIKSLIAEARAVADRARNSTGSVAKVTGTVAGLTSAVSINMDHGDTVTVSDGRTTATYVHSAGFKVEDFVNAVNSTANLNVKASLTSDNRLHLEATGVNSITVGGTATADEVASIGLSAGTTVSSVNAQRQELARAFDAVREKIDAVKLDVGTGESAPVTAASLGIRRAGSSGGNFQSESDITAAITDLAGAEKKLAAKVPAPAANRPLADRGSFAKSAIDLLSGRGVAPAATSEADAILLATKARSLFAASPANSIVGKAGEPLLCRFP